MIWVVDYRAGILCNFVCVCLQICFLRPLLRGTRVGGREMSTRASGRRAASSESKKGAVLSAPVTKRRRKDSSVPAPSGSKAKEPSAAGHAVHSVVMVQAPKGFSLSKAACR